MNAAEQGGIQEEGESASARVGGNNRSAWAISGLFLLAVLGSTAWFATGSVSGDRRLAFALHDAIPGWSFRPEPVAESAQSILGTTNLVNGLFAGPDGETFMVFSARWQAASARSMSVVQHTPDVCWVGAGWVPVDVGQPRQVQLALKGGEMPFECRAFRGPGQDHRELVVWCTLVGGRVLPESGRWTELGGGDTRRDQAVAAYRRVALDHFVGNVRDRRRGSGDKQFVRFSVPLKGDWKESMERLTRFSKLWIEVADASPNGGR